MTSNLEDQLPIEEVLPALVDALSSGDDAVLEAPPGAGKTTRVPLALMQAGFCRQGKILMLEPRRLAARAAAQRMAQTLGEPVGKTVGYRMRNDSKVSAATRVEVVTEGILTRMLQTDPALDGVSVVIFDEFHERSVDADLGLALCIAARDLFRDSDDALKILVMSATLDGEGVSDVLGGAPVISSSGRMWPVDIRYGLTPKNDQRIEPVVVRTVLAALREEQGSVLVFMPGQREIKEVARLLREQLGDSDLESVDVFPLFGDMKLSEQRVAVSAAAPGTRKVVIATSIAETSLTIQGVRVVVDSGLSRLPRFDPRTGMTRLETQRVSKASATQRTGRAGRIEPGVCYRLWSEEHQRSLVAQTPPEILQADLAPLLLSLLKFGIADPDELSWLDAPPSGALSQAQDLLIALGAVERTDNTLVLTPHGERMSELPAHPRLAHMLVVAQSRGLNTEGARLAALLSSRDPLRDAGVDIAARLALFDAGAPRSSRHRNTGGIASELVALSRQFEQLCDSLAQFATGTRPRSDQVAGYLTALAYPDRVARRRDGGNEWQLANGRSAKMRSGDSLSSCEWLAVAHVGGTSSSATDQVYLATELDPSLFDDDLSQLVQEREVVEWAPNEKSLCAERRRCVGSLTVASEPVDNLFADQRLDAVMEFVKKRGLSILPFDDEAQALRQRIEFLRGLDSTWPDLSDEALLSTLDEWLRPYADRISHINHFAKLNVAEMLAAMLVWPQPRELDELAPTRFKVPSGSMIRLDYSKDPPVLPVKLQEMFGCTAQPSIANGVALSVALLSPAGRPVQVTSDIAGFWDGSYEEVKKEMKGRYPKHYWPDDPGAAKPSSRTTKRPGK